MKRIMNLSFAITFIVIFLNQTITVCQELNFEELAKRIVNTSANVQAGDVVVVFGGKHTIPLMEAFTIEAMNAGGMVEMFLNTDKVSRAFYSDVHEKFLEQEPSYFAEWLKHINIWISLPGTGDPKAVFADIPEERLAKVYKTYQVVDDMLNESGIRIISVNYPTEQQAAINQIDFDTYKKMHWDAVNEDYEKISEKGNKIKKLLQGANSVKVTSPSGTNFTFSVEDRPIFLDDGIITEEEAKAKLFLNRFASLPGGSVFLAPIETSANGKVVVPKARCRFKPLIGVSFEFKNGKLQNFKAENGGKCFEEALAPYTGPKDMFGYFSLGLNPALKVIEENADYRPWNAAGMVLIGIGDNEIFNGKNKTDVGFSFPITNATVEVDGKVIVKDGQLVY